MENLTWSQARLNFKSHLLLERNLADNSVSAYLRDLQKLEQFLELLPDVVPPPSEVQSRHLQDFLIWLNELGLGARSQARLLSALKTFYRFLLLENFTAQDPTELLEAPRLGRKIPEVLSHDEVEAVLASVDLSHPQGHRNRAILETLYACGLRVSELCELRVSNLFLDINVIKVLGKGGKERLVPIGPRAVRMIRIYEQQIRRQQVNIASGHENILFLNRRGKKLSRVMVFNIVKAAAAAAGISKSVSPHTFRHSFATHLVEGGADLKAVQDMLGHESIITTEMYTHLNMDYLRATILQYHPMNQ